MRYYQPVLTEKEWESGELSTFEVYHYLDNAKKDYPDHKIAVFEEGDIENPTLKDAVRTKIRVVHDICPTNPFEDWDGNHGLMFEGGRNTNDTDYSKGAIDRFLTNYLSPNQIRKHMGRILDMMEYSGWSANSPYGKELFDQEYPLGEYTGDERLDTLSDMLTEWIEEDIDNKERFCEEFGITHYCSESRGYSQGDWAKVFICWTPEFEKTCGPSYEETTVESLEGTFELFGHWAWGDVYSFLVEDEETEDLIDSCGGFYGRDFKENGMMEYIMSHIEDKTEAEVLEILEDIEVEYPR